MNIISFKNVSKKYSLHHENYRSLSNQFQNLFRNTVQFLTGQLPDHEPFYVLRDINFEVRPGEFVGIIGSNGAGKTTLLRLIANVTKPTIGKINVLGHVAPLISVGAGFHPELTGRENVYLNGVILGMSKHEINQRFDEIVAFSELEKFIDAPIKQYSSGMYVRLGFSVAMHSNFDILLADEILAVGDERFQEKCFLKFDEIKKKQKTLIFVSHNLDQIKKHCERGIFLENGQIISDDKIETVCSRYQAFIHAKENK